MKGKKTVKALMTGAAILSILLMTGCGAEETTSPTISKETAAAGTVLLSVNPEIEVEYDEKGLVLEIEGMNDDGKSIVGGYEEYNGRKCDDVINELIQKIYENGYFEQTVGGNTKNIVIKLEEGSVYPEDDFLEGIAQSARSAVEKCGVSSSPVTIDKEDITANGYIGLEKAKELVLAQLGLDEATFADKEYKLDDGVYELEFTSNGVEYEFEIHAVNGKVLEADYENNRDWDDDRDDRDESDDINDDLDDDNDDRDDVNDSRDDDNDDRDDVNDGRDDDNDDRDDINDGRDDVNDDLDDINDNLDDVNDDLDDINDDLDDVNDDRDDINDNLDDDNDDWDDVNDGRDDVNDDLDDINDDNDDWDDVNDDLDDDNDDRDDDNDD